LNDSLPLLNSKTVEDAIEEARKGVEEARSLLRKGGGAPPSGQHEAIVKMLVSYKENPEGWKIKALSDSKEKHLGEYKSHAEKLLENPPLKFVEKVEKDLRGKKQIQKTATSTADSESEKKPFQFNASAAEFVPGGGKAFSNRPDCNAVTSSSTTFGSQYDYMGGRSMGNQSQFNTMGNQYNSMESQYFRGNHF